LRRDRGMADVVSAPPRLGRRKRPRLHLAVITSLACCEFIALLCQCLLEDFADVVKRGGGADVAAEYGEVRGCETLAILRSSTPAAAVAVT
jgi:hypothetical protein